MNADFGGKLSKKGKGSKTKFNIGKPHGNRVSTAVDAPAHAAIERISDGPKKFVGAFKSSLAETMPFHMSQ